MKSIPVADVDKGQLDKKPKGEEADKGAKGEGGAGGLGPDEEVEYEHCCEKKAGEKESGLREPQLGFRDFG